MRTFILLIDLQFGQSLPLFPSASARVLKDGAVVLSEGSLSSQVRRWCWQSSGLSAGALLRTPTHASPCGCLAWLAAFQGRTSRHGGREGTKEKGNQGQKMYCLLQPSVRSCTLYPSSLHYKWVVSAGSYSEGEEFDSTFRWEECEWFFWTWLKTILCGFPASPSSPRFWFNMSGMEPMNLCF